MITPMGSIETLTGRPVMRHVIFLSGPIGVGKTSLGKALALEMNAAFIDGDDLRNYEKPWFGEALTHARTIVSAGCEALLRQPVLVVAQPLRARDWVSLKARFTEKGIAAHCVTLAARLDAIIDPKRGRSFDPGERTRIAEMIQQGYASRPFSDLIIETDRGEFDETLAGLSAACRQLLKFQPIPRRN